MIVPRYITQELKAIDSMYFAVFNSCIVDRKSMSVGRSRWQIRKWVGNLPKRLDLWNCHGYSEVIMTICKEEMGDRGLVDAGYEDIDRRAIDAIRASHWWKSDWKRKVADIDWRNERMVRFTNAELDYQSKYVAKRVWRSWREPTINLSGKEWKV